MTDEEKTPMVVTNPETGEQGFACRICVANSGMVWKDVSRTEEAFTAHLREQHPDEKPIGTA